MPPLTSASNCPGSGDGTRDETSSAPRWNSPANAARSPWPTAPIERQLTSTYHKLGIRSRFQMAATIAE